MARRRRKPAMPSLSYHEDPTGHRVKQSMERLRRPSPAHVAKRPRTVGAVSRTRTRGELHHPDVELELGETEGLAELDDVIFSAPRTREMVLQAPAVDHRRQDSVVSGLLSAALPDLELEWMPGARLDLGALGAGPLVLYCHPGSRSETQPSELGEEPLDAATAECRAFAEHCLDFASFNHRVVGVSSQSAARQLSLATSEALPHVVLSDDRMELAEELGLPTFEVDGACHYERVTLIVRDGHVEKVFYPVPDPATHAAEVAAWLRDAQQWEAI